MKHILPTAPLAYDKIADGSKKVEMRLFDKTAQQIRINDTVEFVNTMTKESVLCQINGFAIFENFSSIVDNLPVEMLGYSSEEEIRLRIERMYRPEDIKDNFAIGFFIRLIGDPVEKVRDQNYHYENSIVEVIKPYVGRGESR